MTVQDDTPPTTTPLLNNAQPWHVGDEIRPVLLWPQHFFFDCTFKIAGCASCHDQLLLL